MQTAQKLEKDLEGFLIKNLAELGWILTRVTSQNSYKYILTKPPADTSMMGVTMIEKIPAGWEVQAAVLSPENEIINAWGISEQDWPMLYIQRIVCGCIESYLSGATNIKERKAYYRQYRLPKSA